MLSAVMPETVAHLNRLNRRFYRRFAAEFERTRRCEWPGWRRLLGELPARDEGVPWRVIDVGCGSGRFAPVAARRGGAVDYLGVDFSPELLDLARSRDDLPPGARFVETDVLDADRFEEAIGDIRADLVVAFGLFHHLPGRHTRRALAGRLASLVADGGALAVSLWRFLDAPRIKGRRLAWPGDLDGVDERDALLPFGDHPGARRYCHDVDDAEADALIEAVPLPIAARFRSDGSSGRLNQYLLWTKTGADRTRCNDPT